jgi:hypothetical protein
MKKLSLNLEQLSVESFETVDAHGRQRGTVRGNVCSDVCTASCPPGTCGILPASAESECNALPGSRFGCPIDTDDISGCQPCCV